MFKFCENCQNSPKFDTLLKHFCIFVPPNEKVFGMEQMQFSAIVLMSLLTLAQVFLLPKWVKGDAVLNRARRLFSSATALLAVQFLLQYIFKFREMGVTQAVAVNLLFFIPCGCLFCMALFCLQRSGHLGCRYWLPWLVLWLFTIALMVVAEYLNGWPMTFDTPMMYWAEVVASVAYALVQCCFSVGNFIELRRMKRALDDYYDRDMSYMLSWMKGSIIILAALVMAVPPLLFVNGMPLAVYSVVLLSSMCYLVFSFACYAASNNSRLLMDAERNADDADEHQKNDPMHSADYERVGAAAQIWIEKGKHLRAGVTVQEAANEMKVPRYQLTAWIKTTGQEMFGSWLSNLRIEEAKQLMIQHPEWSNDVIAERCGFTSRSYFQTVFKKQTGVTPANYLQSQKE